MGEDRDGKDRSPSWNADLVRRAIEEIWNQGNLDEADRLFTDDYVNVGGLVPDVIRGPEAIKLAVALHHTAFPRLSITIDRMISEGQIVAFQWIARNSAINASLGPPLKESDRTLEGMAFCRIVSGKIAKSWVRWDSSRLLSRLVGEAGLPPGLSVYSPSGLN